MGGFPFEVATFELLQTYFEARGFALINSNTHDELGLQRARFHNAPQCADIAGFSVQPGYAAASGDSCGGCRIVSSIADRTTPAPGSTPRTVSRWAIGRLSIIDLSPAGHQPMTLGFGPVRPRIQRRDLQPRRSAQPSLRRRRGHLSGAAIPDTETLLAGFDSWGVRGHAAARASACLPSPCGIARAARSLLARDRAGEKPLYYGRQGKRLPVRLGAGGAARASELSCRDLIATRCWPT